MCFLHRSIYYLFLCCLLLSSNLSWSHQGEHEEFSGDIQTASLGEVDFPISCGAVVQPKMNHGLALIHHMMYAQAERHFKAVIEQHPDCAMLYWGHAMTRFHPLWPGRPSAENLSAGAMSLQKAMDLQPGQVHEQAYIKAAKAFYDDWEKTSHVERIANWERAQKALYEAIPESVDAAALYALSHLATAPKTDQMFVHQKYAGKLLEQFYKRFPKHPGLIHYTIHAYDNTALAEFAVGVARAYDKIAPDVPHALHMPTHIFIRLGIWRDANSWNIRSAKSALKYPAGDYISHHYLHALDYLVYGYLQLGEVSQAEAVLASVAENEGYQETFVSAYALAAIPARLALEQSKWAEAASLAVRSPTSFPWQKFPEVEAITYFARGLGAARSGDINGAERARVVLDGLYDQVVAANKPYWAVLIDSQRKTVSAWRLYAMGKHQKAIELMRESVKLENSVDKHPVTPGAVLPAQELLADMLVLNSQDREAVEVYTDLLANAPNRFNSLFRAGKAAQKAGELERAKEFYSALLDLVSYRDDNEALVEASDFLKGS